MRTALLNAPKKPFFAEQTGLNVALYEHVRTFARLPAWCNWVCNRALPVIDDNDQFLEAGYPHRPLGIVHMTSDTKKGTFELVRFGGGTVHRPLTYPGSLD